MKFFLFSHLYLTENVSQNSESVCISSFMKAQSLAVFKKISSWEYKAHILLQIQKFVFWDNFIL